MAMKMLTPDHVIDAMLAVPYVHDKGDWSGADCFGIVELWYRHVLGIEVSDRKTHPSNHDGLAAGYSGASDWKQADAPTDHALVVMRAGRHPAGHIGVFYGGSVLHSDAPTGCVYEPIGSRFLRRRITGYLVRK